MLLLLIISVVVTVVVWTKVGVVWGLVTGVLLVGGIGWRILAGLFGLVRMPFKPGWREFVNAWEELVGDPKRSGWDIPGTEVRAMRTAYKRWRADGAGKVPAREWLQSQLPPASTAVEALTPGERRILTQWHFDIWSMGPQGWEPLGTGPPFRATRSFKWEEMGPFGNMGRFTHVESCEHFHQAKEEALPCLEDFRRQGAEPSLAILDDN